MKQNNYELNENEESHEFLRTARERYNKPIENIQMYYPRKIIANSPPLLLSQ